MSKNFNIKQISKLGLICGNGDNPLSLIKKCEKIKLPFFIAGIKESYKPSNRKNEKMFEITEVSKALKFFKQNGVSHIIMIGGTTRPKKMTNRFSLLNIKVLLRLFFSKSKGDNTLLLAIKNEIEKRGFKVIPTHFILPEILTQKKIYTKTKPNKSQLSDISLGIKEAKKLGLADIGQAVVIANGKLIAIENEKGTANLIKRVKEMKLKNTNPILVKAKKPQQDDALDIPTIGENTIRQIKDAKFSGVAIESQSSYITNDTETTKLANENKIFVIGF